MQAFDLGPFASVSIWSFNLERDRERPTFPAIEEASPVDEDMTPIIYFTAFHFDLNLVLKPKLDQLRDRSIGHLVSLWWSLTDPFLFHPFRRHNLGVEFDERMQIVLVGEILEILANFGRICVEAAPIWIRLERIRVGVGGNVACTAWISILIPSSPDCRVSGDLISNLPLERPDRTHFS